MRIQGNKFKILDDLKLNNKEQWKLTSRHKKKLPSQLQALGFRIKSKITFYFLVYF